MFRRIHKQGEFGFSREEVSISCFGRHPNVLRQFLEECRCHHLGQVRDRTSVFEHQEDMLERSKTRNKRQLPTVVLEQKVKGTLIKYISDFLEPTTQRWYANTAILVNEVTCCMDPLGLGNPASASQSQGGLIWTSMSLISPASATANRRLCSQSSLNIVLSFSKTLTPPARNGPKTLIRILIRMLFSCSNPC